MNSLEVHIIGGGLAGCEAAWQLARRGYQVKLFDMKPNKFSPAHESENLAELVCSNSLRSADPHSAVGLLKDEMRTLDSLIMKAADETAVPAGKALAVDREKFAEKITSLLTKHPLVSIIREEIESLPEEPNSLTILATGPLTSEPLAESLACFTGKTRLYFYDAIAPILYTESLDMEVIYQKSRYDDGPGDYLNCPLAENDYLQFIDSLNTARYAPLRDFEEVKYFEGCLPIEVMSARGIDTLRYGPMKPVGLEDPRTNEQPYAVVQLRKENKEGTLYNMVGFQTKLKYGAQADVFRMIPGLENAEFARLGGIHRNTFLNSPKLLDEHLRLKSMPRIRFAGQITGVEGYVESAAMGLLAGRFAAADRLGQSIPVPPHTTALGALVKHITGGHLEGKATFQPMNINFGLFPAPPEGTVPTKTEDGKRLRGKDKGRAKKRVQAKLALEHIDAWVEAQHALELT